jgi:RNA polymerase sigma factor (sigma-70 family)
MPGGVRVIVRDPPPAAKEEEEPESDPMPQAVPQEQRVVVRPPAQPGRARAAFFRELDRVYRPFLLKLLLARRDVLPASAEDVSQAAMEIFFNEADADGLPPNVERFLGGVLRNLVRNRIRNRKWAPDVDRDAVAEDVPWAAPDPAEEADQEQRWSRLFRHLATLSEDSIEEAEAVQCIEILGMTDEEAAAELGRPKTTVQRQAARGSAKLKHLALVSDRAAELGLRRRDGGA